MPAGKGTYKKPGRPRKKKNDELYERVWETMGDVTRPKPPRPPRPPRPPKPPKSTSATGPKKPAPPFRPSRESPKNKRTGEDYLKWEERRKKKK